MKNILIALVGIVLIFTLNSCEDYESYQVTDNCSYESVEDQAIHDFYTSYALIIEKVHESLNGSSLTELEDFRNSLIDKTDQEFSDLLLQDFGVTSAQLSDMTAKASIVGGYFNTVEEMEIYMTNLTNSWVENECFEVQYDLDLSFGENYIETRIPCWQVALKGIFGGGFAVAGGIVSVAVITMANGDCY